MSVRKNICKIEAIIIKKTLGHRVKSQHELYLRDLAF